MNYKELILMLLEKADEAALKTIYHMLFYFLN